MNDIKRISKKSRFSFLASHFSFFISLLFLISNFSFLISSCTFDYGESESSGEELPDLIMQNVDYVRVRSADPIARIRADRVERYDKQGVMKLENFSFEQYGETVEEVNASGMAGYASVIIDSGDISMDRGVRIDVETEDIIIETNNLEWKDEEKIIFTGAEDEVNILQNKGTSFTGIGLRADARSRTWEFFGAVGGTFVHEDKEEETVEGEEDEESENE